MSAASINAPIIERILIGARERAADVPVDRTPQMLRDRLYDDLLHGETAAAVADAYASSDRLKIKQCEGLVGGLAGVIVALDKMIVYQAQHRKETK